jgi:hypothetical protein
MASFTEQIARRFPQLERFPESERLAFVRDTRKGWLWGRLVRLLMPWFLGVLAAVVLFAAVWRAMTWGLQAKALDAASDTWMVLVAASYAVPVALGFVAWAVVRRRLLWRRVREAINDGRLPGASPRPDRTPVSPRARRRYALELVAMLLIAAAPFVAIGVEAWSVFSDSRRARSIKPGAAALNKLIATLPPAPGKPGEQVWVQFIPLWRGVDRVEEEVWKEMGSPHYSSGNRFRPAYASVGSVPTGVSAERLAEIKLENEMGERMLPALKAAGLFDAARLIVGNSNVDVGVPSFSNDQPLALIPRPGVRDTFSALRFNLGRMSAAIKSRDLEEFTDAFRVWTAAARVFEREPFFLSRAQALSIDAIANDLLRQALMSNPPLNQSWLERIDVLLAEAAPRVPLTYTLEADRIAETDLFCFMFLDPASIAQRRLELWYRSFKDGRDQRFGSLSENLAAANERTDWFVKQTAKPRVERPVPPRDTTGLVLQERRPDAITSLVRSVERAELDRRGLTVVCALEKFRAAHGRCPGALSELVPEQLKSIPVDPWSGRPFSYRVLTPGDDPRGRNYLVYIWGNDNVDDGGKESYTPYDAVVPPTMKGIDYVINYVDR